jgi:hypothetical protein
MNRPNKGVFIIISLILANKRSFLKFKEAGSA